MPVDSPSFSELYLREWPYSKYNLAEEQIQVLQELRASRADQLDRPYNQRWWRNAVRLPDFPGSPFAVDKGFVNFGSSGDLTEGELSVLHGALMDLKSWRKGPFRYAGIDVDAEWRSDFKWDRIMELIRPELRGRRIADVGCNNLYYMYRMLEHDPELVVGCEPVERYFFYHYLNRKFFPDPRIHFELFGVDDMAAYGRFFDTVFFMGVLYHRRHPLLALETLSASMRPGGELIIESAGIPGDDDICLFPGKRYMRAPGWWFLPTASALENMLLRTGFEDVKICGVFPMTHEEQRKTEWVDTQSLESFLDEKDDTKTVEGYPAPVRIYAKAVCRG